MAIEYLHTSFGSTEIHRDKGLDKLKDLIGDRKSLILTDAHIHDIYSNELSDFDCLLVPQGESVKSLEQISNFSEKLIEKGLDRDSILIAFGGGAITDFTGFLASIYKRGISFGLIPTTVLAQVDAAIGGKTGVNMGNFKNMIGTFSAPEFILINSPYCQSLEDKDYIQGFAEVIKHALIRDEELFSFLESNVDALMKRESSILKECIERATQVKIDIVRKDDREKGIRKLLNFGHTIAHAIEKTEKLSHGDAVALGMVYASKVSMNYGLINESEQNRIVSLIQKFNLPIELNIGVEDYFDILIKDKKAIQESVDYVLLNGIGQSEIMRITFTDLKKVLLEIHG